MLMSSPSSAMRVCATPITRKVDKLSCVRFGSARYSVPNRLIGATVAIVEADGRLLITDLATGEIIADHAPVAPRRGRDQRRALRRPAARATARRPAPHPDREGVPGTRPGRRNLADRLGRLRQHPPGRRSGRADRARRCPRTAGAGGRVAARGTVPPMASRGRPLHPRGRSRHTTADRRRGRAGDGPAHRPDPVADRLRPRPDRQIRETG
ncbi:Mu transposase domain-containing protein [Nonomuraea sp. NPDC050022]|uniref:Mu transposase domain-containing protein n=1 Tax=Nonomuraea sp. NPDC050022 TaxID=3364358 RepID=UPI00379A5796